MSHKEKISFGEFDSEATEYVASLVREMLAEKGINPSSYSFSIEVEYTEDKDDLPNDELSNIRNWDGYGYYKRAGGS
jgi:hypothetical protein|tara:strand:+ start:18929 stop:19159 length:231 start_codon:yes stop_codon:yes gene_type:complete